MSRVRPFRCLDVRTLFAALAMAAALLALAWIGRGLPRLGAARIAIAAAEVVVLGVYLLVMVRSIRRLDELEQRIHLEAFAAAGTITLLVVSGWGFLVKAGLPAIDWSVWVVPVIVVTWVAGVVRIARKYR